MAPEVSFGARAMGEELRSIWVREFENGAAVFSVGPWE